DAKPKAPRTKTAKPAAPAPKATPAPGGSAPKSAPKAPNAARVAPKAPAAPVAPRGTVVDVTGLVLGRAASHIAQRLLKGEMIVVINAEKSVVTGSRENILAFYTANRARGSKRTGPHYPRYPDRIFRRTVRGMLPHLKTRGKEALDRLDVYIGVPSPVASAPRQSIDGARSRPSLRSPMTLEDITKLLGARL
ncbi:MAG: 50S ribosomal protein L13, partial [Thermoplasmata archaeon]|nr:50S ribosomal protein L13 [Thermoplasmata archaeon]